MAINLFIIISCSNVMVVNPEYDIRSALGNPSSLPQSRDQVGMAQSCHRLLIGTENLSIKK